MADVQDRLKAALADHYEGRRSSWTKADQRGEAGYNIQTKTFLCGAPYNDEHYRRHEQTHVPA